MADEREEAREEKIIESRGEAGKEEKYDRGSADGIEESGRTKERSKTELDIEGLDEGVIPQEGAEEKHEADDGQKEKVQRRGIVKREYILISFSLLLVLIVISGGVFIWARYFAYDEGKGLALSVSQSPVYELKPFFAPLNSKDESKMFLRLALALELSDGNSYKQIAKQIEGIRSNIFKILVNVSPKSVGSAKGKKVLAEKIISTINLLLEEKIVRRVFFRDVFVI